MFLLCLGHQEVPLPTALHMNKYAVEGVVGEGAYGVVLKCRNKVSAPVRLSASACQGP